MNFINNGTDCDFRCQGLRAFWHVFFFIILTIIDIYIIMYQYSTAIQDVMQYCTILHLKLDPPGGTTIAIRDIIIFRCGRWPKDYIKLKIKLKLIPICINGTGYLWSLPQLITGCICYSRKNATICIFTILLWFLSSRPNDFI